MHTLIVAVALLVVATGAYVNFNSKSNLLLDENDIKQEELVLSEFSDNEKQIGSGSSSPKTKNVSSPTVFPTKSVSPKLGSIQESFVYPNAVFVRKNENVSVYTSSDHPDVILKWYKDFLQQKVVKVNSQIVTKANDNYLYKLVAIYESKDMNITIRKNAGDKYSEIEIEE
ncbi:MAG: hypothetical protein NZM26_01710 [Patescibacteria group bacterium]|nr:hypothetical protein [Patescibacteria group bacterium]